MRAVMCAKSIHRTRYAWTHWRDGREALKALPRLRRLRLLQLQWKVIGSEISRLGKIRGDSRLHPQIAIQRSVLDRFGKMFGFEFFGSFKIGNRAGNFDNPNNRLLWRRPLRS
jgi:hypothetical protein